MQEANGGRNSSDSPASLGEKPQEYIARGGGKCWNPGLDYLLKCCVKQALPGASCGITHNNICNGTGKAIKRATDLPET
ncbi:hypothetical protein WDV93_11240 [Pantoea ananatis]